MLLLLFLDLVCPTPFGPNIRYPTGRRPVHVIIDDSNKGTLLDLAVTNADENTTSILLGNGNGTFQNQTKYFIGSNPVAVSAADFNKDDKLDLVVANSFGTTIGVLLGNGDGIFQDQKLYIVGYNPSSIITGDFNKDSKLDLAVTNRNLVNRNVTVILGNGDGTFQSPMNYAVNPLPIFLTTADFNNDTKLDFAVANGDSSISILLSNGDGTFKIKLNIQLVMS